MQFSDGALSVSLGTWNGLQLAILAESATILDLELLSRTNISSHTTAPAHNASHTLPTSCAPLDPLRSSFRSGAINTAIIRRLRFPEQYPGLRSPPNTVVARTQMHINTSPATGEDSAEGA